MLAEIGKPIVKKNERHRQPINYKNGTGQCPSMEAAGNISFMDPKGTVTAQGEAKVVLGPEALEVRPREGGAKALSLRDIVSMSSANYLLDILLFDGSRLRISGLGRGHDDMTRELHASRNALIMSDLLMGEKLRKQGVKGELKPVFRGAEGPCEVRLYDTALVLLPLRAPLMRIRYSDIVGIEASNYALRMELESGERLSIVMLGRELDPLWKGISDAMAELEANVQGVIKDLYPPATGEQVSAASRLLKEGRAARRQDLEDVSPDLFRAIEARLRAQGMGAEYDHLLSLGEKDMLRIGIKRSLVPTQEGDYMWFMIPILGRDGNAVAMEATSGPSGGRATYFFRVTSRSGYGMLDREEQREAAERSMDTLTRGLQDVNFRRQPIYLADDQLQAPQYSKYRFSVMLMPSLRDLRSMFIGRVAHTSPEDWTAKVNELLAFNARAKGDERWTSAQELPEED